MRFLRNFKIENIKMKKQLQPKYLPIPIAIIILVLGMAGGVYFINLRHTLFSKASSDLSPQQVKISNISHSSFVVSWLTTEPTTGSVALGETGKDLDLIKKDVRDQGKTDLTKSKIHFVLIDGLKPQTKYFFKIISGGKGYLDGQKPFEVTTAQEKVPPDNDIAQGKIQTPDGKPAEGVLVYLSLANTVTQAAITDSSGNWMIPLSTARSLDLQNFSNYDRAAQIIEITARGESLSSKATLTTAGDNPTPLITLGQNYDFLNQMPDISPTPTASQNPINETEVEGRGGFPSVQQSTATSPTELSITFPSENEQVNSSIPEFLGTGPEGEILKIEVESDEKINGQTPVDSKGSWKWSPPASLSPGEHTITVSYTNKNGILEKVSRSFIILAAGESSLPSFTATPSAQISTTPTIAPTPTTKATPTLKPSPTAKPTQISSPSTESGIPVSGINVPTKFFLGAGITTLMFAGLLLLFGT